MKVLKTITALFAAAVISFSVQAQSSTTTNSSSSTTKTTTAKPASATVTPTAKPTDPVNKSLKGPNGETVYTGSKGGNYYINKSGNKTYLKK